MYNPINDILINIAIVISKSDKILNKSVKIITLIQFQLVLIRESEFSLSNAYYVHLQ